MAYMIVNGEFELPYPKHGLQQEGQQLVDSARNANGTFIGEKKNRRQIKNNLEWNYLTAEQWHNILEYIDEFVVDITYYDIKEDAVITREFYWGNSTAVPFKWDDDSLVVSKPLSFTNCKCNLIDVGA